MPPHSAITVTVPAASAARLRVPSVIVVPSAPEVIAVLSSDHSTAGMFAGFDAITFAE